MLGLVTKPKIPNPNPSPSAVSLHLNAHNERLVLARPSSC